jgi:hypothetical protein
LRERQQILGQPSPPKELPAEFPLQCRTRYKRYQRTSPEGDIKNVSCRPPWRVYVEGRQVGFEIVCEEMVNDWWRIIGKTWYNYTDWSATACYNINHLAAADTLYYSLRRLLTLTDTLNIKIFSAHIQGILNTESDRLSRLDLSGDYFLKEQALRAGLETLKLCPQLDLFATKQNRWCTHYCSLKRDVSTPSYMGNAMHLFWPKNNVLLLNPPIPLLLRSLQKFEREGKVAVLIAPDWNCQIWTPILKRLSVKK